MRWQGVVLALSALTMVGGCSRFNLVPPCSQLADEVALALIPNRLVPEGGQIDRARALSIVRVSDLQEVSAGYNQRVCRGQFTLASSGWSTASRIRVEQAEGAQHWHVITFLDADMPDFSRLAMGVQRAYGGDKGAS